MWLEFFPPLNLKMKGRLCLFWYWAGSAMAPFLAAAFFMLVHHCLQLSNKRQGAQSSFPQRLLPQTAAQMITCLSLRSSSGLPGA